MSNTSHAGIELWLAALSELARLVECAVLAIPHARCLGRRLGCWASGRAWAAPRTPEARLGCSDPNVSSWCCRQPAPTSAHVAPPCASRLTALREWGVEAEALLSFMFGVTPATVAAAAAAADESGRNGGDDGDGDGGDCEGEVAEASTREGAGGGAAGGDGAGWDNPARSWQVQRSQPVLWELHFWAQVRGCTVACMVYTGWWNDKGCSTMKGCGMVRGRGMVRGCSMVRRCSMMMSSAPGRRATTGTTLSTTWATWSTCTSRRAIVRGTVVSIPPYSRSGRPDTCTHALPGVAAGAQAPPNPKQARKDHSGYTYYTYYGRRARTTRGS